MELKIALKRSGYSVRAFWDIFAERYAISYHEMCRYGRSICSRYLDQSVWAEIKKLLRELRIEWKEYDT